MYLKTLTFLALVLLTSVSGLYGPNSKVIKLTEKNFNSEVIRSKELWFVEFFAPWCGHCKSLAPEYDKVAAALNGIVKVGAVDMDAEKSLGGPYGIKGFPTIKFFGTDKNNPIDYSGERTSKAIAKFALEQIRNVVKARFDGKSKESPTGSSSGGSSSPPKDSDSKGSHKPSGGGSSKGGSADNVIVLTDSDFDKVVMGSDDTWLVEFYAPWCGHCKKLEPEWSEAATKLKGEVKVGKVDATTEKQLAERFGVKGYPTIKFFPGGKKRDSTVEDYSGSRDASSIVSFATERKAQLKPVLKPEQLVNDEIYNSYCREIKGVCIIAFLPHLLDSSLEERNRYVKLLEDLSAEHKMKPVSFLWSQGGDQFDFEDALSLSSGYPAVVAISFAKKKYGIMRAAFGKSAVDSFITGLMTGKEVLYNIAKEPTVKKVARWDGQDIKRNKPETNTEEL